jgi:hypothetical protein
MKPESNTTDSVPQGRIEVEFQNEAGAPAPVTKFAGVYKEPADMCVLIRHPNGFTLERLASTGNDYLRA